MKNVYLRKYFNLCAAFGKRCKSYEQGEMRFLCISFSFEQHTTFYAQLGMLNAVLQYQNIIIIVGL